MSYSFFETAEGQRFITATAPAIAETLDDILMELKKLNGNIKEHNEIEAEKLNLMKKSPAYTESTLQ